ncbi:MAG TPA: DUF349 domain-containing protein [Micromonosporaceae bacterium]
MSTDAREWTAFGRIDADGTVYVKTAAGERQVGSWQAGTPEEGLLHFARRFADLVVEVDLLQTRLASGAADPQHTRTSLTRMRESLETVHAVGDFDTLAVRIDGLIATAERRTEETRAARAEAKAEAIARKEALATEAERIAAESTQWKAAGDRMRQILDEWKTIRVGDRKTDTELWRRYAAARDAFSRRRGSHFATLDAQRKEIQSRKEALVVEAEELAGSTDWGPAATRMKQLMAEWKAAGRASRETEQRLWDRFRAAQDGFFARRSEVFSQRDAEAHEHLETKRALLTEAEALDVEADPQGAQRRMREILARWHDTGRIPREAQTGLDRRLRAVEEKVRQSMESAWRRTAPEESPLLAQMRSQVAEAEQRLERAREAGDPRRIAAAEQALASKRRFLELAERSG